MFFAPAPERGLEWATRHVLAANTTNSTFSLGNSLHGVPPTGLTLTHNTIQVIGLVCTWTATPTNSADTTFSYGTDPFVVTVSYTNNGITKTAQAFISVDSETGCYDGQSYPAPAGYTGG